ncbi:MAG: hypothetical protein ACTHU0_34645 [Kofleriaceae bacterium]
MPTLLPTRTALAALSAIAALASMARPARAGDPRPEARRAAQDLEARARSEGDDALHRQCGAAYLDLYTAAPSDARADETLYQAAVCFDAGRDGETALRLFDQLHGRFPRAQLAPRALHRAGLLHASLGACAEAADRFESYAKRYAGERDAADALVNAMRCRAMLGEHARQLEDLKLYERNYAAKSADAPAVVLAATTAAEHAGPRAAIAHLRRFLTHYGRQASEDQRIAAAARLAELLWRQSCPVEPVDGLCVRVAREPVLPVATAPRARGSRCASRGLTVTPVARDARLAREAMAAFAFVGEPRDPRGDRAATARAAGLSAVRRVDRDLEALLALAVPRDDVSTRAGAARWAAWLARKQALAETAVRGYQAAGKLHEAAAAARIGQVHQLFASQLEGAEVPRGLRGPAADAYCAALDRAISPAHAAALAAFAACLRAPRDELSWSALCERERSQLDPVHFPPVTEVIAPPAAPRWPISLEPAVRVRPSDSSEVRDALDAFAATDEAAGRDPWKAVDARASARRFTELAKRHPRPGEAHYMAGLALHRAALYDEARGAYLQALAVQRDLGSARSNLASARWQLGDPTAGRDGWQAAWTDDPRLAGAQLNTAGVLLDRMRQLPRGDAGRAPLATRVRSGIRGALAASGRAEGHLLRALLELEDDPVSPAAAFELAQASRLDGRIAAIHAAQAVLAVRTGVLGAAPEGFSSAGLHLDSARAWLRMGAPAKALDELGKMTDAPSYDQLVARGTALRGLDQLAEAEAAYLQAIQLDGTTGAAHYNLAVLHVHQATRATSAAAARDLFRRAAAEFRRSASDRRVDGDAQAKRCDAAIAALP